LITGPGFGCGSSREQAVWTLLDAGIRCVIAQSFGEIFYANCFQNGLLPIALDTELVGQCAERAARGVQFDVDLVRREVRAGDGGPIGFSVPEAGREALLQGWDGLDQVLFGAGQAVAQFEAAQGRLQPWLWE
jgi:3-isopropylmalate dehydratase small subunit